MLTRARYLVGHAAELIEVTLARVLSLLAWRRRRRLARREGERSREAGRWFTPGEALVVVALASLIVPSDDGEPGANEADVTSALDRLLAHSAPRQSLYAHGLLACDEWALRQHGRLFVDLTAEEQLGLLRWVDRVRARWAGAASMTGKAVRRVVMVYTKWRNPLVELFPGLVRDVQGAFYTSRVSWQWLGYDGPPMPQGYPDLRERESH
jgi:hypothetical protein